jgi:NADPH:quinone reductase-like Zn-dependent oxidoreductase
MKAIQIKQTGGSEVLEYVEMEMPIAGPGQAVIRTESRMSRV